MIFENEAVFGAYQCSLPVSYQTKYMHKRMEGCDMFCLIKLQYITFYNITSSDTSHVTLLKVFTVISNRVFKIVC